MHSYTPAWTAMTPNRFYDEPNEWQFAESADLVLLSKKLAEIDALWRTNEKDDTGCSVDH